MFQWATWLWRKAASLLRRNDAVGATQRRSLIRRALAGDTPGIWASDHYEESTRVTGWTFCAVRSLALQFAQSKPHANKAATLRLLNQPNPGQAGALFRYAAGQQLQTTGTAYIWTVRNGLGEPVEQYVLPTGLTRAQAPSAEFPAGSYRVNPLNNLAGATTPDGWTPNTPSQTLLYQGAEINADDVRAVRWPHPLYSTDGLSPLAAGALTIDLAEQIERARWYAMRNAATPGLVLKLNGQTLHDDEQAQLEDEIAARNSSPHNARRNLLLPEGVDYDLHEHERELDYVGSHTQARDATLALHGTPPVAIGVTEAGSYAAFYASMLQYVELTVQPALDLLGGELSAILDDEVRLTARRIDDPDVTERKLENDVRAGAITVNEYRAKRGYPPVPWGNEPIGVRRTDSMDKPGGETPGQATEATTSVTDPTRRGMPR